MNRPADLFDRTREWAALAEFATPTGAGLRVGVVSGRRRQGKSFLLRRIVRARAGLYHQAQELRPGIADLARLEHIRELLVSRGRDAGDAKLALFSREGFDAGLIKRAARCSDVHLITLEDMCV